MNSFNYNCLQLSKFNLLSQFPLDQEQQFYMAIKAVITIYNINNITLIRLNVDIALEYVYYSKISKNVDLYAFYLKCSTFLIFRLLKSPNYVLFVFCKPEKLNTITLTFHIQDPIYSRIT